MSYSVPFTNLECEGFTLTKDHHNFIICTDIEWATVTESTNLNMYLRFGDTNLN